MDSVKDGLITITNGGFRISEGQRKYMKEGNLPKPFNNKAAYWSRFKRIYRIYQFGGEWVRTGYEYEAVSKRFNLVSLLFFGPVLFFSLFGFRNLYEKRKRIFWLFLVPIIIYTLLHVFTIPYTEARYRLPLDALFIIVGCFGITQAYEWIRIKTGKQSES